MEEHSTTGIMILMIMHFFHLHQLTSAGTLTLSGNRVTSGSASDLNGSIVTISGFAGDYTGSTEQ